MKKFLMLAVFAAFFANVALADDAAPAGGDKPAPAKKSSKSKKSSKPKSTDKAPADGDKAAAPANP
jgi:hypothetical protein